MDEIADFLFAHGIHTKKGMVCGMMFTAETRIKRQKNGNVHVYVYYRCTRKSKAVVCREPHIRAEELDKQLSALLLCYAMPASWADKLRELIDKDEANEKTDFAHRVAGDKKTVTCLSEKMQRLLDSYLNGDVERELYQVKRAEILGKKKLLEEKNEQSSLGVSTWVEPMKQWIETAVSICKIAKSHNQIAKKSLCLEIFGSNLQIRQKEVVINDDQFLNSPQKNRWSALRTASEKAARSGNRFRFSSDLVRKAGIEPARLLAKGF